MLFGRKGVFYHRQHNALLSSHKSLKTIRKTQAIRLATISKGLGGQRGRPALECRLGSSTRKCREVGRQRLDPTFRSRNEPPVLSESVTVRMRRVPRPTGNRFKELQGKEILTSSQHVTQTRRALLNDKSPSHFGEATSLLRGLFHLVFPL